MQDTWWMWVLVAVVAVVVVGAVLALNRRNEQRRLVNQRQADERHRLEADHLRREAGAAGIEAQRREADAAAVRADAEEARIRADELERQAGDLSHDATRQREAVQHRHVEADRLDPDVPRRDDAT